MCAIFVYVSALSTSALHPDLPYFPYLCLSPPQGCVLDLGDLGPSIGLFPGAFAAPHASYALGSDLGFLQPSLLPAMGPGPLRAPYSV